MSGVATGIRSRRDDREWSTGMCWLYCRMSEIPVLRLGPITAAGLETGMYGCEMCVAELEHMVKDAATGRDT
ncbi:hypothetical protein GCM10010387_40150 [Streptomyces inusitatus]|uniref:Uncharacterized protein n=1 Tax=Streptomyces inusitatus TaxID=68221 RepID=A0A918UXY6_9ACTN|nr:hypothetical protein [Streptomyces inusitatus]GGZ41884.1 hypothetical protein GCM10010387_40150 [Streptomyces inusitatus]